MVSRKAAVAGYFYPKDEDSLVEAIEASFTSPVGPQKLPETSEKLQDKLPFFVAPHAGYIYSGPIAAWAYYDMSKYPAPKTVIILCPNHTGLGHEISTVDHVTEWETPLGGVDIDTELVEKLCETDSNIMPSDTAHSREHSVEVHLPFLQYVFKDSFKLVPIAIKYQHYDSCIKLGQTIAKNIKGENVLVLASSDFTHQEPYEQARKKDLLVLDSIVSMNPQEMYTLKQKHHITMCGVGPIAATIQAALDTNRTKGEKLQYASSGDTAGDKTRVVGYASVKFYAT